MSAIRKIALSITAASLAFISVTVLANRPFHGGCGPMGCGFHNRHAAGGCTAFGCGAFTKRHGRGGGAWVDAFGVNSIKYNKHNGRSVWNHCGAFGCTRVKSHTFYRNGHRITRSKICHDGQCHVRKW